MSRRRYIDRAVPEGHSRRDFVAQRYRSERLYGQERVEGRQVIRQQKILFNSDLERDFAAMKRVWQMLRYGGIRMIGEIGRQY